MTWLLLLRKYWLYAVLLLAILTLWGALQYEKTLRYRLGAAFETYKADVAQTNADAQKAARAVLDAQIRERVQIDKHNAEVLRDYETANAALAADRDHSRELARRLLAAAQARSTTGSGAVSEAGDRRASAPAGEDSGDGLAARLARVAEECRGNAAQLNALLSQLQPQL